MRGGAVDLFCGVGGASLGLQLAGFQVLGAVDIDNLATEVYSRNLGLEPLRGDLRKLSYRDVLEHFGLSKDDVTLLVGCPPCQAFSTLRRTRPWRGNEPRDELLLAFLKHIEEGRPNVVVFENVPGIVSLDEGAYLKLYLEEMRKMGYGTVFKVVRAADYGVPQFRRRVFAFSVLGAKSDDLVVPNPTHSDPSRVDENGKLPWKTVRDAISDLPPLEPGEEDPSIPNHRARKHGEKVLRIIRSLPKNGGSRKDLPEDLWLPCHVKLINKGGAESVYGRMWWDKPAPTMTTRCTTPSSGRFVHPEQDRAITPREAARLQTFPDWFTFPREFASAERLIGNAVPPDLLRVLVDGFFKENGWIA